MLHLRTSFVYWALYFMLLLLFCENLVRASTRGLVVTTARVHKDAGEALLNGTEIETSSSLSRSNWTSQEDVRIVRFVDSGRFSDVFEAVLHEKGSRPLPAIIKVLKPTFISKIKREIRMLEILRGVPGIVQLHGIAKNSGCQTVSLIFESLGEDTHWLSHRAAPLTSFEIQLYMYKLLQAIEACHSKGVMHRDVKPRNVIYNRKTCDLRIIDLGLSDLYIPEKQYNPSVASRHYKSPELLFGFLYYDYCVDIWSVGCLFAGLIFDSEPFFCGADHIDQIQCIAGISGSDEILKWAYKYGVKLTSAMKRAIGSYEKMPLSAFRNRENSHLCSPDAIDLATKMLRIDHQERLTAQECLAHKYFDGIRKALSLPEAPPLQSL